MRNLATVALMLTPLVIGALLATSSQVAAQEPQISISDTRQVPGGELSVEVSAQDIPSPGLGAWTIDVMYDPTVVTAIDCAVGPVRISVCNPAFADNTVRLAGADAHGLEGNTLLARITFRCGDREAETPVRVSIHTLADATVGGPQPLDATLRHGSIACVEEEHPPSTPTPTARATPTLGAMLPIAGSGGVGRNSAGSIHGLVAGLAVLGAAAAGSAVLLRRGRRP